jgi:hypothetical protein
MVFVVGALVAGAIIGIIALCVFAAILRRAMGEGRIRFPDIAALVALLFGSTIASTAIGNWILDEVYWWRSSHISACRSNYRIPICIEGLKEVRDEGARY